MVSDRPLIFCQAADRKHFKAFQTSGKDEYLKSMNLEYTCDRHQIHCLLMRGLPALAGSPSCCSWQPLLLADPEQRCKNCAVAAV